VHRNKNADKPLLIGNIPLSSRVISAPLAGISDLPFRLLAKSAGCGLVCFEMISSNGLVYRSPKTWRMLASDPAEKPVSVQIFGSDPSVMATAARYVEDAGADIIDINFGCSVKKVLKTGAGAALMRDYDRARDVIKAVRESVFIPLTIKMRTGWDPGGDDAFRLSDIAQKLGVDAIAIHPRTAIQGFKGRADWSIIAKLRKMASIPLIGNGDIINPHDASRMMEETGCDAVMVGRAAIGAPWIFSNIKEYLEGREFAEPSIGDRFDIMFAYLDAAVRHYGEAHGCRIMRSRLGWFARALPGSASFRRSICRISSRQEAVGLLSCYRDFLLSRCKTQAFRDRR